MKKLVYNLIQSGHSPNNERGGICIYKYFFKLRILNDQYLLECINLEIEISDKGCNFISLYKFPSETLQSWPKYLAQSKEIQLNRTTLQKSVI